MNYTDNYEAYRLSDPVRISNRLGIPFDLADRQFHFSFLGHSYTADHPDLRIRCTDGRDPFSLDTSGTFRDLLLRFLLQATVFPVNGEFRSVPELPGGEAFAAQFDETCVHLLAYRYGRVLQAFEAIMEDLDGLRVYGADIAYELEFLDGLFIRFLLNRGTEKQDPSAEILFSSNFPAAFSAGACIDIIRICLDAFDAADPLYAAANPYR